MKHPIGSGVCIAILVLVSYSPTVVTAEKANKRPTSKSHLWLMAGQTHETCMKISSKENLSYQFSSTQQVDFDIHYHDGEKVQYSLPITALKFAKSTFSPKSSRPYCLMWNNKNARAVLLTFENKIQLRSNKQLN